MDRLRQYIEQISPLTELTWNALSGLFQPVCLKKMAYFAEVGRVEASAAYVVKGVFRAFYRTAGGVEHNKTFFVDNDFVGAFSSLVTGQPNQIYIQALTDCDLYVAEYLKLTALYAEHPDWERFMRRLAEYYFVAKEQREFELTLCDANERYRLFRLEYPALEQLIPQYEVASYLGITPTHLSRIRAKDTSPA